MTSLDFSEHEPPVVVKRGATAAVMNGNRAFYERLQGQTRKSALERYGWVALPIGAAAILGIVALTSTPHSNADDVTGPPAQSSASTMTASHITPTPAIPAQTPQSAATDDVSAQAAAQPAPAVTAPVKSAPAKAHIVAKAPAPVRSVTPGPASAVPVQSIPAPAPAADPVPATPATPDVPPTLSTPAPAGDTAPAPAAQAAPTDNAPVPAQ